MKKGKLKIRDESIENNLFIISVDKGISKDKTIIVYADHYIIDEFGNAIFRNKYSDKGKVFTITSGNWESIIKYEDGISDIEQPVRCQTLKEHFEELEMALLELEEAKITTEDKKTTTEGEKTTTEGEKAE